MPICFYFRVSHFCLPCARKNQPDQTDGKEAVRSSVSQSVEQTSLKKRQGTDESVFEENAAKKIDLIAQGIEWFQKWTFHEAFLEKVGLLARVVGYFVTRLF